MPRDISNVAEMFKMTWTAGRVSYWNNGSTETVEEIRTNNSTGVRKLEWGNLAPKYVHKMFKCETTLTNTNSGSIFNCELSSVFNLL